MRILTLMMLRMFVGRRGIAAVLRQETSRWNHVNFHEWALVYSFHLPCDLNNKALQSSILRLPLIVLPLVLSLPNNPLDMSYTLDPQQPQFSKEMRTGCARLAH